jgi:hypothetical protein
MEVCGGWWEMMKRRTEVRERKFNDKRGVVSKAAAVLGISLH